MKKILGVFGIILLVIVIIILFVENNHSHPLTQSASLVQATEKSLPPIVETIVADGTLQVDPRTIQHIHFSIPILIQHLFVFPGQKVTQGETLFDFIPAPSAQLNFNQAKSDFIFAESEAKRTQHLYQQQLATQSQLAAANKAAQDAKQALQLAQWHGGFSQLQQYKAPFDGIVTKIATRIGNGTSVNDNTVFMKIGHCDYLLAQLYVNPRDVAHIAQNAVVTITMQDKQDHETSYQGTVLQIMHTVDPHTHRVNVWVSIPHLSCQTWPVGMKVKGKMI